MMPPSRSPRRRTRRRTRMSPDEVQAALFECALSLFRDEGYEATSIARLTREAGVAKGTFFNHFPTKEHILAEFMARIWDDALEEAEREEHRGTDAIVHVFDGLARRLEAHWSLIEVLATRMGSLPLPLRLQPADDPADATVSSSTRAESSTRSSPPIRLLQEWVRWTRMRIEESLPIAVPLQAVAPADLAALLGGAITASLLEVGAGESPPGRNEGSEPAPVMLGRRAVFLLRSAGFVAPDPPTRTRP